MQSESERALTLGANDSIARSFAFTRWVLVSIVECLLEDDHTSQFSRIKQRPPATDLSGGNASDDPLTPWRNNLAVADALDFQRDPFLSAVSGTFSSALRTCWT